MDVEEEALFAYSSHPCDTPTLYYVQSPSYFSVSQYANPHFEHDSTQDTLLNINDENPTKNDNLENPSKFNHHSRSCSSSRFMIINAADGVVCNSSSIDHHGHGKMSIDDDDDDDDKRGGWWKHLSFGTYPTSWVWLSVQLGWRLMLSFAAALLVFYIATKPPPPLFSLQMVGIHQFELSEGVDASGVTTNFLSCNSSLKLIVDNKSNVFGLHILPPLLEMSFDHLPFVAAHGPVLYALSRHSTQFKLYMGTSNKPMYGAGRSMQDALRSGKGLPLLITLKLTSKFKVLGGFIHPTFHHHASCFLVLHNTYDHIRRSQIFNSSCGVTH